MNGKERLERLREVVVTHPGRYHVILAQVDPDAIGCAMGIRYLLRQLGVLEVDVYHCGVVGHPQNRCIVNRYNLARYLRSANDLPGLESPDDHFVLADSSLLNDSRFPQALPHAPIIVVDHHRGCDIKEVPGTFVWVDEVGAASTLVTELIGAAGLGDLDADHHYVAVLLALGIYTDTKSLVSGNKRDREAYGLLTANIPPQEIASLIDYPLSPSHFQHLKFALNHMERQGSRLLANAGVLDEEHGDDLSTIADYLIRMEGISLVVVWGIVGNRVRISARNTDLGMPLEHFLRKRFGTQSGAKMTPDGRGEGGALLHLDLGFWMAPEASDEILAMVSKRLKSLVFSDMT